MTTTEELRRLLDERGVEYEDRDMFGKHVFHWGVPLHRAMFTDGGEWTDLVVENASPEQAITATLGAGECTLESTHGYCDPYVRTAYQIELSCHTLDAWDDPVPPSYCPYCGKRVVKEDA